MGVTSTSMVDRRELANAAIRLIELRPLVAGSYVKLYPVSFRVGERMKRFLCLYSDKGFEDCLPSNILKQCQTKCCCNEVSKTTMDALLVMRDLYMQKY